LADEFCIKESLTGLQKKSPSVSNCSLTCSKMRGTLAESRSILFPEFDVMRFPKNVLTYLQVLDKK
jgi:hypothetical protein